MIFFWGGESVLGMPLVFPDWQSPNEYETFGDHDNTHAAKCRQFKSSRFFMLLQSMVSVTSVSVGLVIIQASLLPLTLRWKSNLPIFCDLPPESCIYYSHKSSEANE